MVAKMYESLLQNIAPSLRVSVCLCVGKGVNFRVLNQDLKVKVFFCFLFMVVVFLHEFMIICLCVS